MNDKKTLHLPLKAQWYEMIESGVKTEEYREIKPYWEKRLVDYKSVCEDYKRIVFRRHVMGLHTDICKEYPRGYTHVKFSYGYTKHTMTFEIKEISIGMGNPEWGAPDEEVFIIKLGKRIL